MIVAHPDDEIIWGGHHLLLDDWLVVCLTYCDTDIPRGVEFQNVMSVTGNKGVMLGFPDISSGKIDKWKFCLKEIHDELNYIITLKDWDMIVTHNPDGEYYHKHHVMTSHIVSSITTKNLYYFGRYYNQKEIVRVLPSLDHKWVEKKKEIMTLYKSQGVSANAFEHMYPYEHFIAYSEWRQYKKSTLNKLWDNCVYEVGTLCKMLKWHCAH